MVNKIQITMEFTEYFTNIMAALIFGSLIGLERQFQLKEAGLRTNALVALGSSMFISMTFLFPGNPDVTRIAAQIVTGIGFLGAGIMFKEGATVKGLNTAATVWCTAAIGSLAGAGFIRHAAAATGLIIITHIILRPLANKIKGTHGKETGVGYQYFINTHCVKAQEMSVRTFLLRAVVDQDILLQSIETKKTPDPGTMEVNAVVYLRHRNDDEIEKLLAKMMIEPGVVSVKWTSEEIGQNDDI
ncbi:MAG: MgtC/SapB family protein [Ignavibacteriales bacterium]|nr:MAG: MgtC/SapB family protein [Ignavibacteriales bacterium]